MAQQANPVILEAGAPGWSGTNIRRTLQGNVAYEQVTVRYVHEDQNYWTNHVDDMLVHSSIVGAGRLLQADRNYELDPIDVQLISIGDAFGLGLAPVDQELARRRYHDAVVSILADNAQLPRVPVNGFLLFGVTEEQYGNVVINGNDVPAGARNQEINFVNNTLLPLNFEQAFNYVQNHLAQIREEYDVPSMMTALTTAVVSVCKTGTVSNKFNTKIASAINTELNQQIDLSPTLIRRFYSTFVRRIDAISAQGFFERTLALVPEVALRVRLTIEQASDHGITGLLMVRQAMMNYPTFRWHLLDVIKPGECRAVAEAFRAWDGNRYAGFSRNLGPMAATNYKLAVYTAKKLLMECSGMASLRGYRGGEKGPIPAIDNAITTFRETRENIAENAEDAPIDPANMLPAVMNNAREQAAAMFVALRDE